MAVAMRFIFLDSQYSSGIIRNTAHSFLIALCQGKWAAVKAAATQNNTRAMIFWPVFWSSHKNRYVAVRFFYTWCCGLCSKHGRWKARGEIHNKRPVVFSSVNNGHVQIYELEQNVPPQLWTDFHHIQKSVIKRQDLTGLFRRGTKRRKHKLHKTREEGEVKLYFTANKTLQALHPSSQGWGLGPQWVSCQQLHSQTLFKTSEVCFKF